jgi:hypothetical protein
MHYKKEWHQSPSAITDTSGTVVIGPVDISCYDRFVLTFKGLANTAVLIVEPELATVTWGTASSLDFVAANTAIIAAPSALGTACSVVMTSAVNNSYRWLRVKCHTTACNSLGPAGKLIMGIGGFQRYT